MRELDRFKVIQDVADGKLKPWRAAERLERRHGRFGGWSPDWASTGREVSYRFGARSPATIDRTR
ncbi:hypothetical protein WI88_32905 [Burkholderia ubonensis]|nr:hypothetical protein WI88_32905 [Burkholderia ubonensis]